MTDAGTRSRADGHRGDYRVTMMYHPSHHVPDLGEAERWFADVFGRPSTNLAELRRGAPPRPGYPSDYSTFTFIGDVLFDTIDPKRYVLLGVQRYARWSGRTSRASAGTSKGWMSSTGASKTTTSGS